MAHEIKVVAKLNNLNLIPGTHMGRETMPSDCLLTSTCAHKQVHINIVNKQINI